MELRQMRYFVKVVEAGSIGRAAKEMGIVSSGLSQQLARLESDLSTRLLHRTATGVKPTDAGLRFYKHAQLALRHTEAAAQAAQHARLAGQVSVGISSSAAAVMALPFIERMKSRYPDIRVRLVGSLSLNLVAMLNARQLDMAVLFETGLPFHGSTLPLLEEGMFLIGDRDMPEICSFQDRTIALEDLGQVPLVMGSHIVRSVAENAFGRIGVQPNVVLEVDSLEILMTMVSAGFAATIQPGAITARLPSERIRYWEITSPFMRRKTVISSISEPEMPPAALAVRIVLRDVARDLVTQAKWPGAIFAEHGGTGKP